MSCRKLHSTVRRAAIAVIVFVIAAGFFACGPGGHSQSGKKDASPTNNDAPAPYGGQ